MALGYQNPFYPKQAQQKQQSLYNGEVLLETHDPPVVYDSEETLQLAQESRLKMKQLNKEIKPKNYAKINQLSEVFVSQKAKSHFKSLAKEADESFAKHKALEYEIDRLLKAVVSQDIMSIVQSNSVVDTSNLQTELEHTLNPFSQKLENENVELEFRVLNYARENEHLKRTYKNLFDSINVTRAQTKTITDSLQQKLHDTIYENAKLRAQLFDKVIPKVGETNALLKPVTSNLIPDTQESKVVNNKKVIPGNV
ncbi:hypothetical protein Tco_1368064 [Tanacetum coccineum]